MIRVVFLALALLVGGQTAALELKGPFTQGALITGTTVPGSSVTLDGVPILALPNGSFVFGLSRNADSKALVTVRHKDGRIEQKRLKVRKRNYRIQRIDGLPKRKVTPKTRDYKRIARERKLLNDARQRMTKIADFQKGFMWPAHGRISGVYGSQRILNGKPRAPHLGVDVAAPTGSPVVAASDGVVSLTHEAMFFTGKTIQIDHGIGVGTIYIHLSEVLVKKGQRVRKGQLIGRIGKTGRATGPHLHWGLTWKNMRLDPALLVGPMPDALKKQR
ncbi:MAG: peptidoglycan DD-metalloendopeptidase family protein [Alphaproteobacteria bacterium]|nr:peptidoglycan DD-metalloendopeptidase family protein [Alphaproteobacteria bacterium]